jgi:hypothetical protein
MTKVLALLCVTSISIAIYVLTLMWGWGLEPKNWWAIIGLGVFGQTIMYTIGRKVLDEK